MIGMTVQTNQVSDHPIEVVGVERKPDNHPTFSKCKGEFVYWCVTVIDGRKCGDAFAVGSDEWKEWVDKTPA